jgi:hypothetical protein
MTVLSLVLLPRKTRANGLRMCGKQYTILNGKENHSERSSSTPLSLDVLYDVYYTKNTAVMYVKRRIRSLT